MYVVSNFLEKVLVRAEYSQNDLPKVIWCNILIPDSGLLFLGISSFEDYPLDSGNPYSSRIPKDLYTGIFPGWLHNMHDPENHFPHWVQTLLMSQSDFELPTHDGAFRNYNKKKVKGKIVCIW